MENPERSNLLEFDKFRKNRPLWFPWQLKAECFTVADFGNCSKVEIFEVCNISEIFKNHRYFKNQENLENSDNLKNLENLPNCSNLLKFEKF